MSTKLSILVGAAILGTAFNAAADKHKESHFEHYFPFGHHDRFENHYKPHYPSVKSVLPGDLNWSTQHMR